MRPYLDLTFIRQPACQPGRWRNKLLGLTVVINGNYSSLPFTSTCTWMSAHPKACMSRSCRRWHLFITIQRNWKNGGSAYVCWITSGWSRCRRFQLLQPTTSGATLQLGPQRWCDCRHCRLPTLVQSLQQHSRDCWHCFDSLKSPQPFLLVHRRHHHHPRHTRCSHWFFHGDGMYGASFVQCQKWLPRGEGVFTRLTQAQDAKWRWSGRSPNESLN